MSWLEKRREECYDGASWVPDGKARNWAIYLGAYLIRPIVKLLFRYRVKGLENVPRGNGEGPYVFACNHVSYADPFVLWCVLRSYFGGSRFLARTTLFKPFVGGFIARVGAIPINPSSADRKALKRAAAALKRGENLLIFPEGTRMNKPWKVYKPHGGVVLIAQMGKAKVVPVGISGTERIMPYGTVKIPRFHKVHVSFGAPIDVRDERFSAVPKKERSTAVATAVMDEVFALRDTAAE